MITVARLPGTMPCSEEGWHLQLGAEGYIQVAASGQTA